MEPQPSENIEDILGPQNQSNSDHLEDHDFLDEYKKDIVPDDEPDSQESNGNNVLVSRLGGAALAKQGDEDISFYTFGIEAIEKQFDHEIANRVKNEFLRIKTIEHETIGARESRGELSNQDRVIMRNLTVRGINATNLTPSEAGLAYAYATDATPDIVKHKAERLIGSINKSIDLERKRSNEVSSVYSDQESFNLKAELNDRYDAWERGEVDVSRGFDIEKALQKAIENGYEDTSYLRRELEDRDKEDLEKDGLVDESSLYVLGLPITQEELGSVQVYSSSKYTDITSSQLRGGYKKARKNEYGRVLKQKFEQLDPNDHSKGAESIRIAYNAWNRRHSSVGETSRFGANLSNLVGSGLKHLGEHVNPITGKKTYTSEIIGNTIGSGPIDIEQDLLFDFIADEVLQSRRLRSKEMLIYASSLAIRALNDIKKPEDEYKKVDYDNMRTAISFLGYYSARILGFREKEVRERYGSNRPIKKEFFEEIAAASKSMTEQRADYLNDLYKGPLTKMDEHVFNVLLNIEALNSKNQFINDEWD